MESKKRTLWIIAVILWIVLSYLVHINVDAMFSTYKFAIAKEENKEYFEGEYEDKGLNVESYEINNVVNNYSPLTEIILKNKNQNEIIKIEHAVQVVENDLIRFTDLDGFDYFFSAIEIPNGEDKVSINIQNNYNNVELEPFGTYLFIYKINEYGNPIYGEPKVKNISSSPNKINEKGHLLYVKIYKFPKTQSDFLFKSIIPKGKWFTNKMIQNIEITQKNALGENEIKKYTFKLHWIKWMSMWDEIIINNF